MGSLKNSPQSEKTVEFHQIPIPASFIYENYFPYMGAQVTGGFSLGAFHDTFEEGQGITDQEKLAELKDKVAEFEAAVLSA